MFQRLVVVLIIKQVTTAVKYMVRKSFDRGCLPDISKSSLLFSANNLTLAIGSQGAAHTETKNA